MRETGGEPEKAMEIEARGGEQSGEGDGGCTCGQGVAVSSDDFFFFQAEEGIRDRDG